eukprot:SM000022S07271  [mRNA]  locus=s22:911179:917060:+ [translate_table: standard]
MRTPRRAAAAEQPLAVARGGACGGKPGDAAMGALPRREVIFDNAGLQPDMLVQVAGVTFYLHKFPLLSKCGLVRDLLDSDAGMGTLDLDDLPGGAAIFEIVANFCYTGDLVLTTSSVGPLRCAAEFLDMAEGVAAGNLGKRTDAHLGYILNSPYSRKDCLEVLRSCEGVFSWAESLGIISSCCAAIARSVAAEEQKDAAARPTAGTCAAAVDNTAAAPFTVLCAISLNASVKIRDKLEWSISKHLEACSLEDLLIPTAFPEPGQCSYDIETVQRLLSLYTLWQTQSAIDSPTSESSIGTASAAAAAAAGTDPAAASSTMPAVMELLDSYLVEVAADPSLSPAQFQMLAESLPAVGRASHDRLYQAIDIYLRAHPSEAEEEVDSLCEILDCRRFTIAACSLAAQNELLPHSLVVEALFNEQLQLQLAADSRGTDATTTALPALRPIDPLALEAEYIEKRAYNKSLTEGELKLELALIKMRAAEQQEKALRQEEQDRVLSAAIRKSSSGSKKWIDKLFRSSSEEVSAPKPAARTAPAQPTRAPDHRPGNGRLVSRPSSAPAAAAIQYAAYEDRHASWSGSEDESGLSQLDSAGGHDYNHSHGHAQRYGEPRSAGAAFFQQHALAGSHHAAGRAQIASSNHSSKEAAAAAMAASPPHNTPQGRSHRRNRSGEWVRSRGSDATAAAPLPAHPRRLAGDRSPWADAMPKSMGLSPLRQRPGQYNYAAAEFDEDRLQPPPPIRGRHPAHEWRSEDLPLVQHSQSPEGAGGRSTQHSGQLLASNSPTSSPLRRRREQQLMTPGGGGGGGGQSAVQAWERLRSGRRAGDGGGESPPEAGPPPAPHSLLSGELLPRPPLSRSSSNMSVESSSSRKSSSGGVARAERPMSVRSHSRSKSPLRHSSVPSSGDGRSVTPLYSASLRSMGMGMGMVVTTPPSPPSEEYIGKDDQPASDSAKMPPLVQRSGSSSQLDFLNMPQSPMHYAAAESGRRTPRFQASPRRGQLQPPPWAAKEARNGGHNLGDHNEVAMPDAAEFMRMDSFNHWSK